jgi:methylated-DNA-[protein]-cysteine S-methyltransferase
MGTKTHFLMESPIGVLTLINSDGVLSGLYTGEHRRGPGAEELGERAHMGFERAEAELREYFEGRRRRFTIPLAIGGTTFQREVWKRLCEIPFGETRTYGQIAEEIGNAKAVRAVGLANGRNPISIVVPCHRVIGSDGSLTGYGGGIERKRFLLELEGAVAPARQMTLV